MGEDKIIIKGARVNCLKNITLEIPRGKFVVITGISGSGKSSLAFDTLYAEGQRRFAESLSSYARQFLGRMSKPDVDSIEGIPPAIAIQQRVNIRNPRSTVATTTEIYEYVRLIFARIGRTYSPVTGREVHLDNNESVVKDIMQSDAVSAYILADMNWVDREDKVELLLSLKEQGYTRLFQPGEETETAAAEHRNERGGRLFRSEGSVMRIEQVMQMAGNFPEHLMLLVDRVKLPADEEMKTRLWDSVQDAFARGDGNMAVWFTSPTQFILQDYCNRLEADGIVFRNCDEYLFSFNSPIGACQHCGGLGRIDGISEDLVIPDKSKSIYENAIAPYRGEKMGWFRDLMCRNGHKFGLDVFKPYCQLTEKEKNIVWKGVKAESEEDGIIGLDEFFKWVETQRYKIQYKYMLARFSGRTTCPECGGSRLRKEAMWVRVGGRNIREVLSMTISRAIEFFKSLHLDAYEHNVAGKAVEEVLQRLECLRDVGLQYLTLDRASNTLSGGESQRISLVTALGSCLVGSLYVLDEPSIGLHSRDTDKLITVLKRLRDIGNTVVVVEHDEEIIRAADQIIDLGPGAGDNGGSVIFQGKVPALRSNQGAQAPGQASGDKPEGKDFAKEPDDGDSQQSLTLQYLEGRISRFTRKKRTSDYHIILQGAQEHNLKDIDVRIPLGCLTAVTGVSGSGKSTLVGDILYPALQRHFEKSAVTPGIYRSLGGNLERIGSVEYVDQNPIGKSTRSNAVTYLKIYDDIRKLLSEQQYARISGYTPSFFSFNQDGGRCPECQGEGFIKIPMQFMSDVVMVCEACDGKRFKSDILQVRYRGKNVDDILSMSVNQAIEFFKEDPNPTAVEIARRLQFIADVGLGYIKLGQSSSTLSGGESQRIKLAYFLSMSADSKGKPILFIFDEPTTGLHFKDVETLIKCLDQLISRGHSVIVVEHNLDVIKTADWMIDLGPEAGDKGGHVVYEGVPELAPETTYTGKYLRKSIVQ